MFSFHDFNESQNQLDMPLPPLAPRRIQFTPISSSYVQIIRLLPFQVKAFGIAKGDVTLSHESGTPTSFTIFPKKSDKRASIRFRKMVNEVDIPDLG